MLHVEVDSDFGGLAADGLWVSGISHTQVRGVIRGLLRVDAGSSVTLVGKAADCRLINDGILYVLGDADFTSVENRGRVFLRPGAVWRGVPVTAVNQIVGAYADVGEP